MNKKHALQKFHFLVTLFVKLVDHFDRVVQEMGIHKSPQFVEESQDWLFDPSLKGGI